MFDRLSFKAKGKQVLHKNIGGSIIIIVITSLIPVILSSLSGAGLTTSLMPYLFLSEETYFDVSYAFGIMTPAILFSLVMGLIVTPFIQYWTIIYFMAITNHPDENLSPFNILIKEFNLDKFVHFFLKMFVTNLFIVLWSFLFIIPGVIKSYSYYLVPYIAIEKPELGILETIRLSNEKTKGYKFDIFVMEISFFLWHLLSTLTFGIASLYVSPYVILTNIAMYQSLTKDLFEAQDEFTYQI